MHSPSPRGTEYGPFRRVARSNQKHPGRSLREPPGSAPPSDKHQQEHYQKADEQVLHIPLPDIPLDHVSDSRDLSGDRTKQAAIFNKRLRSDWRQSGMTEH